MSQGSTTRHRPSYILTPKSCSSAVNAGSAAFVDSTATAHSCTSPAKTRRSLRVLAELPKNQIRQTTTIASASATLKSSNQSKSNTDLSRRTNDAELGEKILSCENVSRIVKNSKIPRATGPRRVPCADTFARPSKLRAPNEVRPPRRPDRIAIESNVGSKENVERFDSPSTSNDSTFIPSPTDLPSPSLTDECQKILLGKSDSYDCKRSSGDFDDSLGPISDDELMDISGDVTIRREALDIAAKLASRTPTDAEESTALGFPELAMLDILGGSDLNLSAPKSDISFAIFEDMDGIADASNAVKRGPSTEEEDVPMECEAVFAIPEAEPTASARSPSPIEELPLSSRTPNAPVSIITSITSIMSLDTGYQGDGELSRPESRSAEVDSRLKIPHTESGVQVKTIQFDDAKTMTDSDFFTESDADVHDDLSAAAAEVGSGKGDRKAQIIDGTLYGGANIHNKLGENRPNGPDNVGAPFISNSSNDDMASSGIFSDVEKKPEESASETKEEDEEDDGCGEESTTVPFDERTDAPQSSITSGDERKLRTDASEGMVKSSSAESSSTIQEAAPAAATIPRTPSNASIQDGSQKWNGVSVGGKGSIVKAKMPNRNVTSKVKVLIESTKSNVVDPAAARPKTVRKGKWDAVMDRIAQGKEENKYTPTRFRDVKSKVYQSAKPLLFNGKSDEPDGSKCATGNVLSKTRSRRNVRTRIGDSPMVAAKTARKATSPNSSQRSSISDISVSAAVNKQKLIKDSNQNGIPPKSASTTVINPVTANNNNICANNKHKVKTLKMVQKKSSPLPTRSKDAVQQKNGTLHIPAKDKTTALIKQIKHNSKAFESLAVLLNYCIEDLEAFSTPYLKQKLKTEKQKYTESQLNLAETERHLQEQLLNKTHTINELERENRDLMEKTEEFRNMAQNLKREESILKDRLNLLEEEMDTKMREKDEVEEELKRENKDLVYRIEEASRSYSVLKKLCDKVKQELAAAREANAKLSEVEQKRQRKDTPPEYTRECLRNGTCDVAPDRLESEIESLRQVLALKTDEVSELRRQELFLRENADRVPKLVSTITLLEGKVEDFQSQLSSQTEANRELEKRNYHLEEELKVSNVQKMRLTQKNEELEYKLRQYAEALRQLVNEKNLKEDDIRNFYLYPKTPQKGDCSVIVDSQMKGVVQKSDSVSYMLEMTEDSSEIVTNIIRRAESMRYASRSQTLPKKKRPKTYSVSSMDAMSPFDDYIGSGAGVGKTSTPANSTPTKFPFHHNKVYDVEPTSTPKSKMVKLHPDDFAPNSIDLAGENACEIIEITKSFDRETKSDDLLNEMSCSSCSSSSDNGNNFDIESDIYPNAPDSDEGQQQEDERQRGRRRVKNSFDENGDDTRYNNEAAEDEDDEEDDSAFREDGESMEKESSSFSNFDNVPKTSGGEALIMSSDDGRSTSP